MDVSKTNINAQGLLDGFDKSRELYSAFCVTSADLIKRILEARGIATHSISFRCKDRSSFERKIRKKNKYKTISEITDLVGIRIITHYSDDVDKVAKVIEEEFLIDRDNSIDKRASLDPDRFGYLSLHYVASLIKARSQLREYAAFEGLKLEIQIRSILQHTWAEIEHDIGYKSKFDIPDPLKRKFSRLAGLLELADQEFISIRTENNSYADELDEVIKSGYAGIGLDVISFEKFILNDEVCRSIMEEFKGRAKVTEIPYTNDSPLIGRLAYLGIDGIEKLHNLLCKHRAEVLRMFEGIQNLPEEDWEFDEPLKLSISAPVFYLCHFLASKLSDDEILHYIQVNDWFTEASGNEFYELMINFNGVRQVNTDLEIS